MVDIILFRIAVAVLKGKYVMYLEFAVRKDMLHMEEFLFVFQNEINNE